jgi:hypothetical protein
MAIFNSYVSLPEGIQYTKAPLHYLFPIENQQWTNEHLGSAQASGSKRQVPRGWGRQGMLGCDAKSYVWQSLTWIYDICVYIIYNIIIYYNNHAQYTIDNDLFTQIQELLERTSGIVQRCFSHNWTHNFLKTCDLCPFFKRTLVQVNVSCAQQNQT